MHDVCVFGSANLDLVATAERLPGPGETVLGLTYAEHPGGKGLNQAVAAARCGARVAFVGSVGNDAAGRLLTGVLEAEGIDTIELATGDAPTGRALIAVDAAGENSIVVVPGANATVGRVEPAPATVVLAQLEIPLPAVVSAFQRARRAGATTVLNPAPAQPLPPELIACCDVMIPNEHELALLGGADALLAAGVATIVVTLGARGARVVTAQGVVEQAAYDVDAIDTTAAGDAFCGALCARLAAGDVLAEAVRWAAAAGALATTTAGAVPSLPHRDAIAALMTTG